MYGIKHIRKGTDENIFSCMGLSIEDEKY